MDTSTVRLFISYSRKDHDFVARLTASLEAAGHDVWVDTEDIRGSDQWRASIVAGIQAVQAFLLVVSPNSAASEHVEREVTIAAEEQRRIVPIVIHETTFSGGIRFELAGIQQIMFVGRPFADAMDDLNRELQALAGDPTGVTVSATSAPTSSRRLVYLVVGVLATVVVLFAASSLLGNPAPSESTVAPATTPSSEFRQPSVSVAKTESTIDIGTSAWFSGFDLTVVSGSYDRGSRRVDLEVSFVNTMAGPANPGATAASSTAAALEWGNGRRAGAFCSGCELLPSGASLRTALQFDVQDDFRWDDATLTIGEPREHQVRIPLNGIAADAEAPVEYGIDGVIQAGAGVSFTVERVEVVPAGCWGLADGLTFVPSEEDWFAVVVWGTAVSIDSPYDVSFGRAELVTPDGTRLGSSSLGGSVYALGNRQPQSNVGICFDAPGPIGGDYRLTIAAGSENVGGEGMLLRL